MTPSLTEIQPQQYRELCIQILEKDNNVVKNNLLQQKLLLNQLDFLLSS